MRIHYEHDTRGVPLWFARVRKETTVDGLAFVEANQRPEDGVHFTRSEIAVVDAGTVQRLQDRLRVLTREGAIQI